MLFRDSAVRRAAGTLLSLAALAAAAGCATTGFHERERLASPAMQTDSDAALAYLRTKVESAREGAFGSYGATAPGGCGCE